MKKIFIILFTFQLLFGLNVPIPIVLGETINNSVDHSKKKYYVLDLPADKRLKISLTNLTADIDLFVNINNNTVCSSENSQSKDEECRYQSSVDASTKVYILVYGFRSGSYTLKVEEEQKREAIVLSSLQIVSEHVNHEEIHHYKIFGKKGTRIIAKLSNLTSDADLRMRYGAKARIYNFDSKSTNSGKKSEETSLYLNDDMWIYVHVHGYKSSDYSLMLTSSLDNSLVQMAQEKCSNQNNGSNSVICSNEENTAYVVNPIQQLYPNSQKLYKVTFGLNKSVIFITVGNFVHITNTKLFYNSKKISAVNNKAQFYYEGEVVLDVTDPNPFHTFSNIHASPNGQYLIFTKLNEGSFMQELYYDISDPSHPIQVESINN